MPFLIPFRYVKYGDLELFLCGIELGHLVPLFQVRTCILLVLHFNVENYFVSHREGGNKEANCA